MIDRDAIQRRITYPLWDMELPKLPVRSRLFKLEPIGIGTSEVESLTSYISRLATEHCVSPRALLSQEVLRPAGKRSVHYSISPSFSASQVNGGTDLADIAVAGFERLTLRQDIHCMTLFLWKNIISHQRLLRLTRVWCAVCYGEWLKEGKPIYEPLIWTLEIVSICTKHQMRLCPKCPYCGDKIPLLPKIHLSGHCTSCKKWLGAASKVEIKRLGLEPIGSAELAQQSQITYSVGEILSYSSKTSSPLLPESFTANLTSFIAKDASHSINLFSDMVGIWSGTIRRLVAWKTRLRLEVLCQLCSRLNVSPLGLLLDRGKEAVLEKRHLMFHQDIPLPKEITPWEEVKDKLELALQENPPPSMEAVARRIGYYPPKVKRHFPEICQSITERYWEYRKGKHPPPEQIKKALRAALRENPPPSLQRVFRRLGCKDTGYYYYSNYISLCFAVSNRFQTYRHKSFDKDKDREKLVDALNEDPPPSLSEIAKRLDYSRDFLRRKFPELSKAVVFHYEHYQKALHKEKAQKLRHAIKEAIQQLIDTGQPISERRVKTLIRPHVTNIGRDSLFKQALREMTAEIASGK